MSQEPEYSQEPSEHYEDEEITALLAINLDLNFRIAVTAYAGKLYGHVSIVLGMYRMDAEDIVQKTFINAYFALRNYSKQRIEGLKLRPWLYKIATNESLEHYKKEKRRKEVSLDALEETALEQFAESVNGQPLKHMEQLETIAAFKRAFQQLTYNEQRILYLHFFEEMTYKDINILLDIPEGTIKSVISRVRPKLKRAMQERYPDDPDAEKGE